MSTRTCKLCKTVKPLSEYHKNGSGGHRGQCKVCINSGAANKASKPRPEHDLDNGLKTCSVCREKKTLDQFRPHPKGTAGVIANCRACENEYNMDWREEKGSEYHQKYRQKHAAKLRESQRVRTYKDTNYEEGMYEKLGEAQDHCCKICGGHSSDRTLAVDHCHTTNRVRGLLCGRCNMALGQWEDDVDLMRKAIEYLQTADAENELSGTADSRS